MSQVRDELFLKLALRQGLFSQQEAREFLIRYRTEGVRGEGVGHWLVAEGVLSEEQAAAIRSAIAHRAEGHVDNTRRRVPKRAATPAAGAGHAHGHAHGHHPVRHHHHPPPGVKVTPTQQVLYIGAGVIALGLLMFLVFQFQKDPVSYTDVNEQARGEKKNESAVEMGDRLTGANVSPASALLTEPKWSQQEIDSMSARIRDAIGLARGHESDGRPGKGILTIQKRLETLGETVPVEVQTLADEAIAELVKVVDLTYADALAELRAAKEKGDEEKVEDLLLEIEDICGPEYAKKARAAL